MSIETAANIALSSCTVILPSINKSEAFGLVLVNAFKCAKPVIASNLPGVRTVVDNLQNGLLVEPNDVNGLIKAIKQIGEDQNFAQKLGENGYLKVKEKYNWEKIVKDLENLYKKF